jgi:hypothetical protein
MNRNKYYATGDLPVIFIHQKSNRLGLKKNVRASSRTTAPKKVAILYDRFLILAVIV